MSLSNWLHRHVNQLACIGIHGTACAFLFMQMSLLEPSKGTDDVPQIEGASPLCVWLAEQTHVHVGFRIVDIAKWLMLLLVAVVATKKATFLSSWNKERETVWIAEWFNSIKQSLQWEKVKWNFWVILCYINRIACKICTERVLFLIFFIMNFRNSSSNDFNLLPRLFVLFKNLRFVNKSIR